MQFKHLNLDDTPVFMLTMADLMMNVQKENVKGGWGENYGAYRSGEFLLLGVVPESPLNKFASHLISYFINSWNHIK